MQQKKIVEAEKAIKTLYGEGKVAEVMADLSASGQGSEEQDAGWFDLFSKRYFKGNITTHVTLSSLYYIVRL